ncbi:MFS transporter [Knoellia koreensis]|uniref:Putative tartrate transporter n=1 Tax=Knoellia koreensis TaxID=2730921 RepID=A0A849HIN3_9MICO|nr:MFS transporter [Knoellia sp. DB2414S]NNM46434.1 MFS transporter [Knoellia sp. DB2414S]
MATTTAGDHAAYDSHDATLARATRRVARRLTPFLALLYLVNYLDRTNIGFAGPNGMNDELGLTAKAFGFAAGVFFIGYLLLEVPSNMALHRFGARRWIARILVTWGIVAAAMAFVPNAGWLVALRFLLGVAEAGFFPGIILYLTFWFPQRDRARMTALFMAAIPLSSAIGAPLSSLLIDYGHGLFGMSGWRTMFLFEGIPAILLGVVTWFFLTDRPQDAAWLPDDERDALVRALDEDDAEKARYHVSIRQSLTRPRVWALAFVYFGIVYGLYALGFFLPTIIKGFEKQFGTSYTLLERGLINAIPYAVGAVAMLLWARHGDRTGERTWHVALPAIIGGAAIPVALYLGSPVTAMVAVTVCAVGVMCALPTFWALPTAFLTGAAAASGIALVNSVGNTAGFAAPYITGWLADLTGSQKTGLWVVGAAMVAAGVLAVALRSPSRVGDAAP